jgi:tetratricopeptide (TPR) repeat protein/thiol-disulfide isomerase/thioredoxin
MLPRLLCAILLSAPLLVAQPVAPPRTLADAGKLEAQLETRPDDLLTRALLLRFYFQGTAMSAERAKPLRRKHILWLIEHRPEAYPLSESAATLDKSGHPLADPEAYTEADGLWRKQFSGGKPAADVYSNAIYFYKTADPPFARKLAEEGISAYPANVRLANSKGTLLAFTILGVKLVDRYGQASAFDDSIAKSEEATRAREELETTSSSNLLGGAATAISQQQNPLMMRNRTEQMKEAGALSEHLFQRAIELEPNNQRWTSGLASAYWASASRKPAPEKIALLEKALRTAGNASPRSYVLPQLAEAYFDAGNLELAAERAQQSIDSTQKDSDPNHGGDLHVGNIVLGRIALKKGDIEEAKRRLLAAGNTTSTPVLMSFGPNWNLAQDLFAKGERETVLAYIDLCRKFWTSDRGRLDTWAASIRNGGSPNFLGGPAVLTPQLIGKVAPDFHLKRLKGGELSLAEFKGKVVLLDFWATWCGPCRQEMPDFEKLHRELSSKDVVILAVDANEAEDIVAEYIDKEKYTFPVLLSEGSDVVARYSVNAYPTLVAVDKAGLVADYAVGSGPESEARIRQAIDRARAGAPAVAVTVTAATPVAPAVPSTKRPDGVPPPAAAVDFFREGVRLYNGKDFAGAVTALDRAIQLNPRMASAYEWRGHCNNDLHRLPQAIADYTRSIELFPHQAASFGNRGAAYLDTARPDEALADLNHAMELNPAYVPALQSRVRLYLARQQYAEAIADCDAVLRIDPGAMWASQRKNEARSLLAGGTAAVTAPRLLSPPPGAVFEHFPRETTLVWSEVPGAVSYVAEWDYKGADAWASQQRGTQGVLIQATQPVATFQFIGAQPGRWRVWAIDAAGQPGPKSDWREFSYTR